MNQDYTTYRLDWKRLFWLAFCALACAVLLSLFIFWHDSFFELFPADAHLVLHILAWFTATVTSFAIFAIGWYGYKQQPDTRNLVMALTFFAVGVMSFAHAFSLPDLPNFLSENSIDKALTFFLAAQFITAAGLFLVTVCPSRPLWRFSPTIILTGLTALLLAFILLKSYRPQYFPSMTDGINGLSPFYNSMEVIEIAIKAAAIGILQKRRLFNRGATLLLQCGLMVAIFSDMPFVVLGPAYDRFFISHVFNAAAFYLILHAVFVTALRQPYLELEKTRVDLEHSFTSIGTALASSLELDKALSLINNLASQLLDSPHALVALKKDKGEPLAVRASYGIRNPPEIVPLKDNLPAAVWEKQEPIWINDLTDVEKPYQTLITFEVQGMLSAMVAPILKDSEVLGIIGVYSESRNAFGEPQARLLAAFARQAAVAIENARLFEIELDSRARMESYATQLAILHNISLQLNRETDTFRLLKTVLSGAMQLTDAGVGLMTLVDDKKTEIVSLEYADWNTQRCQSELITERMHHHFSKLLAQRGRESLRVIDFDKSEIELDLPPDHIYLHGLLVGTIRDTHGRVKGHFMLSHKAGGAQFTVQDEEIISLLAAQSSVALISAENFEREHYVAESLQSSLLPSVPDRPDLEMGLLYQSAGPYGRVGGDFYDFVEMGNSRIAVVVGDVCGKGMEAATYTAMIKYMLRAYLGENMPPGDCLTRLNTNIFSLISEEKFITVCLAIIDTGQRLMSYSCAGHPPPLICSPGNVQTIQVPGAVPLGVLEENPYQTSEITIEKASQVILYSDGLIEARPEDGEPFGIARALAELKIHCEGSAQSAADGLAKAAVDYSRGKLRDDVALLVVKLLSTHR